MIAVREGWRKVTGSPPKNLEAEQALLGAILVNNEAIHLVVNFLETEHFFFARAWPYLFRCAAHGRAP